MHIFQMLTHSFIDIFKITFVVTTYFIRKVLDYLEIGRLVGQILVFQYFDFSWKIKFYYWQQILSAVFLEVTNLLVHF